MRTLWAAATALGNSTVTNNVAEYVGLLRLLQRAVTFAWHGLHIIGDSAIIIRMMKERKIPRNKNMQHWYRIT